MKKPTHPKRPTDPNERAYQVAQESIVDRPFPKTVPIEELAERTPDSPKAEPEKNPHAVALGKLGGSKGGKKRAANLTPEKRAEIARKAAQARWKSK